MRHESVGYCFQCKEYPCDRYARANDKDSFITYLHVPADMDDAKRNGLESYLNDLSRKSDLLDSLLENWDNGRLKSFFCLAVNLLPLEDLETVMSKLNQAGKLLEIDSKRNPEEVKSSLSILAKDALAELAVAQGIDLKLRR